jgi:hypothetical protein
MTITGRWSDGSSCLCHRAEPICLAVAAGRQPAGYTISLTVISPDGPKFALITHSRGANSACHPQYTASRCELPLPVTQHCPAAPHSLSRSDAFESSESLQPFQKKYCLHLQGERVNQASRMLRQEYFNF